MKLYKADYHNISEKDRNVWKELEDAEIVRRDGKPTIFRKSLHHKFPKAVRHYPTLETAYQLSRKLSHIFTTTKLKGVAFTKLAQWYNQMEIAGLKSFGTLARTIQNHYLTILNYFDK